MSSKMQMMNVDDDDDNDSFHSFNTSVESAIFSVSLNSSLESDDEASEEAPPLSNKSNRNVVSLPAISKPKLVLRPAKLVEKKATALAKPQHSALAEPMASPNLPQRRGFQSLSSPRKSDVGIMDPFSVPRPLKTKIPKDEDFLIETFESKSDAIEKLAFTGIWVNSQQALKPKKAPASSMDSNWSPMGNFTARLEEFFDKKDGEDESDENNESDEDDKNDVNVQLTLEEQAKGEINRQLFIERNPVKKEPYVSPFEDMEPQPSLPEPPAALFKNKKKPIVVPAGFDLSSLKKYKDPKHWHIRPTTRYDGRP